MGVTIRSIYLRPVTAACLVMLAAAAASAQIGAAIDRDLREHLDFRATAFSMCFGQSTCTVDGVTLRAERRSVDDTDWEAAQLYWDPIDGLGVTDGAQNDEIDFDERIVVSMSKPRPVARIWLSDLFLGEDPRYGSFGSNSAEEVLDDVEVAGVSIFENGEEVDRLQIVGEVLLPENAFNTGVSEIFQDDGDLRRRIILQEDTISILAPDPSSLDASVLLMSALGRVEEDKRGVFEGVEVFEIDLAEILQDFQGARLFAVGSTNFNRMQAALDNEDTLKTLASTSAQMRAVGDWDNGELGADLNKPTLADELVFFAPFDASNDFSVAGIVFADEIAQQ